jgi:hypothetical protein
MRITIGESHLISLKLNRSSLLVHAVNSFDYFFEFRPIRSCVHHQRATDAARNSLGKLQPGVSAPGRLPHQLRHRLSRAGFHP